MFQFTPMTERTRRLICKEYGCVWNFTGDLSDGWFYQEFICFLCGDKAELMIEPQWKLKHYIFDTKCPICLRPAQITQTMPEYPKLKCPHGQHKDLAQTVVVFRR